MSLLMAWKGIEGDQGIYYSLFNSTNSTWKSQKMIQGVGTSIAPSVTMFRSNLYMAWKGINHDSGIYYNTFQNENWSSQRNIPGIGTSDQPALMSFQDRLFMVWKGVGNDQGIYWSIYDGGGWSNQKNISGIGTSNAPSLTVYDDQLFMFWKGIAGDSGIYYTSLTGNPRNGFSWSRGQSRFGGAGTSYGPSISVFAGSLFLVWKGIAGDQGIWYADFEEFSRSNQHNIPGIGTSVGPALTATTLSSVDGGQLYMAWRGIGGDQGIYFSIFNNGRWNAQVNIPGVGTSTRPALSEWI